MNKKKTFGKIYSDLQNKASEDKEQILAIELAAEMKKEFMPNLFEAVNRGYSRFEGDFWIDCENKREPLMPRAFRDYFQDKKECPMPRYDQSVFRYNREKGQIEYWWTIPDKQTCIYLLHYRNQIPPEEQQLLKFTWQFMTGELYLLMKKMNGEKIDSPELEKKKFSFAVTNNEKMESNELEIS